MGAAKYEALAALIFAATSLLMPLSARGDKMERDIFPDANAISAWAQQGFHGGFQLYRFERDAREIIVVVGKRTSGLDTSQCHVFSRYAAGFRLILTREAVLAGVRVRATEAGIEFEFDERSTRKWLPLLFLPWTGADADPWP